MLRTRSPIPRAEPSESPSGPKHSLAFRELVAGLGNRPGRRILDLGPANGANVAYFSRYACKLDIADLYRSLRRDGAPVPRSAEALDRALARQMPEGTFDIVLVWDLLDHLDRTQLGVFGRHLAERTEPGSRVFVLISFLSEIPDRPRTFHIVDEEHLRYADVSALGRPAPQYKEPELLRLLPDFGVETSYLLRHGIQEYVLVRRPSEPAEAGAEPESDGEARSARRRL